MAGASVARYPHMFNPLLSFGLQTTAAVVTCGGLCPGLNDVIQAVVETLHDYGVPEDQVGLCSDTG